MSAEQEPSLTLNLGNDRRMEMTPHNAMLYTFMGRTAIRSGKEQFEIDNASVNHVWIQTEEGKGMYFFATHDQCYSEIAAFMVEHKFPMLLNLREVPTADLQVWLNEVEKTAADFAGKIPDSLPDK